jgi:hypothetical protein
MARRSEWWMRRHPTAPANVAGSVATFGTDFTAPEAVCWLLSWQELQQVRPRMVRFRGRADIGLIPTLIADERHQCTSGCQASTRYLQCLGTGSLPPEEQAFALDAVSVAQHPMCSSSGTAFATPHLKIFGSMFEELGWRIERFFTNAFEPGGPQRENACGLFIPGIVHAACKMKRARPASRPGFRIRIFFEDAEANLRLLRAVGVQLKIVVSFRGCVANVTRDGAARARPTARTGRGQAWASNP